MVRVTIVVQFLLSFGLLKQYNGLQGEETRMEDNRCVEYKKVIMGFQAKLSSKETDLNNNKEALKQMQATIDGLTMTEEANNRTIDDLRNTEKSNNLIIQQQREELNQLKGNITTLTMSEAENKAIIKQLFEKEEKFQATIDGLTINQTKTEETINRTIQELREKQKQLLVSIYNQTNTEETNYRMIQELLDKQKKQMEAVKQSVKCLIVQQKDVCRHLIEAAVSGDVDTTKRWAHCNSDSCTADFGDGNTPLILAAMYGDVEVVRVLLEGGADIHRVSAQRYNALHQAAMQGHLEVCRLLLDRGAKLDTAGGRLKFTALHEAAYHGHLSVVKLLVERGADVRLRSAYGHTAAFLARSYGHTGVAEWLDSLSRV